MGVRTVHVRYIARRPLYTRGVTGDREMFALEQGWEGRVPASLLKSHGHRFVVLEVLDPPAPQVRVLTARLSDFHKGGGWYNVRGRTMRKAEAIRALEEETRNAARGQTVDLGPVSRGTVPDLAAEGRGRARRTSKKHE